MTKVWQLMPLWGVVIGIGTGMTALVLGATVAARWFVARRGWCRHPHRERRHGQLVSCRCWRASPNDGLADRAALMCTIARYRGLRRRHGDARSPERRGLAAVRRCSSEPLPAPPPSTGSITSAAFGALRDAAKTQVFWILFATFFHLRRLNQRPDPGASDPDVPRFRHSQVQAAGLLAAMGVFDFVAPSARAGCRTVTTIAICCSVYGCAAYRCCSSLHRFSFYGLSLFAMFYGLTGSPRCRRRCGSPRSASDRSAPIWCSAGSLGHSAGRGDRGVWSGLSRTVWATYLPAFFAAGACASLRR